jgi:hypothetical protein
VQIDAASTLRALACWACDENGIKRHSVRMAIHTPDEKNRFFIKFLLDKRPKWG